MIEKILTISIFIILAGTGCTGFIAETDLQDDWLIAETEHIVLHYRPWDYSDSASPSTGQALEIAQNQEFYLRAIRDSLTVEFSNRVLIYLFNQDEAAGHIGTNAGGHCIPKLNTIYYTFIHFDRPYTDRFGIEDPALGAHEMVHVISHQSLGYPGTKLMSEGYANWIDGGFARFSIIDLLRTYREKHPERVLTPAQLLEETGQPDYIYYPNAGMFTGFLMSAYGVEKVHRLFNVGTAAFRQAFETHCSETWDQMEDNYAEWLKAW